MGLSEVIIQALTLTEQGDKMDNRKGYVIVIEGTDGCGKQTQAKALLSFLNT